MEGFICSVKFFSIPEVIRLTCQYDGDRSASLRILLLIKLLCLCADGMKFKDDKIFCKLIGCKRCQNGHAIDLWKYCVNTDILRSEAGEYTALPWMREKGLLPQQQKEVVETRRTVQPIKRQIIPGGLVWMTDDEIRELKTELSDEDFRGACDTLDEYLRANPTKNYSSVLIPMRKWCIKKWFETKAKRKKTAIDTSMNAEDVESLKELFRT